MIKIKLIDIGNRLRDVDSKLNELRHNQMIRNNHKLYLKFRSLNEEIEDILKTME